MELINYLASLFPDVDNRELWLNTTYKALHISEQYGGERKAIIWFGLGKNGKTTLSNIIINSVMNARKYDKSVDIITYLKSQIVFFEGAKDYNEIIKQMLEKSIYVTIDTDYGQTQIETPIISTPIILLNTMKDLTIPENKYIKIDFNNTFENELDCDYEKLTDEMCNLLK